ncbi:MAG: site-specific DNA-methyltransferase [Dethiobacter sp.]|jgi:adenine-specific DNA-methyltransferase|nr:MAG: site-specific DNA-methyltransferase [Dethiobacter sp.]
MAKKQTPQKSGSTPVESIRHQDTRKNIPTEELRDFVAAEEYAPQTMLYPRDPSLDPQLVWKGKDEQDREDLPVPVVPIYIQEKIHPQALIDALPRSEQPGGDQLDLFSDFNGLPEEFDQRVDFYRHEGKWSNRLILGDSLLVMNSLAEKEGLKGKVQTIYIDPPYGIKFGSNWQVSTRKRDVKDGKVEDATRQPEQVRAFRDTWKLGIYSYLAYLRDRLVIARELLTETGSVFVQIGDENVHLVRCVLDEVFGSENFIALIPFNKTGGFASGLLSQIADFIIWYAKDKVQTKYRPLYNEKVAARDKGQYDWVEMPDGEVRRLKDDELAATASFPNNWRVLTHQGLASQGVGSSLPEPILFNGKSYHCPVSSHWKTTPDGIKRLILAGRVFTLGNSLRYKRYLEDFPALPLHNVWMDMGTSGFGDKKRYVVQTNPKVIERCLLMTTDPGDLLLDPTCGSGATAYVAEQWGRRWITCDTSRVALALARTRLMAAKYPYYLLADSPEGMKKESELTGKLLPPHATAGDIRKGFVYKRVLHVTLKSIANNPDIKEGMTRKTIDAAIARHADTEMLYDQPYDDKKTVRVSGPFTVESLSPHRVLSTDENLDSAATQQEAQREQDFAVMILDNLRKAGVQNTKKGERLKFNALNSYAGSWLNASGEYTEAGGKTKRVAISIGPEQGTVGPYQVKEAAKEAVQGVGYDLLLVCGFAFDPHVSEEAKRYGNLTVLPTKMNPDLAMGEELLKKTGAGNLFMVFGEPDVDILKQKDGNVVVKIMGVDVYDPTTGELRSSSTDDIACWFIDTDYNGESFFVRHAYFTGADEPYDKLKRALKAEIDEAAWSSLYSTTSRPFPQPQTGKIAIKVINHYGDEVLKVFDV